MTIRTVLLGGTDWSDGQVLYSADLNDTIDALTIKKVYREEISDASTSATTFTTLHEVDVSADTDLFAFNFTYELYLQGVSVTADFQLLITFSDTTTDTLTLTSALNYILQKGSYQGNKKIHKIAIQGKTTSGGVEEARTRKKAQDATTPGDIYVGVITLY